MLAFVLKVQALADAVLARVADDLHSKHGHTEGAAFTHDIADLVHHLEMRTAAAVMFQVVNTALRAFLVRLLTPKHSHERTEDIGVLRQYLLALPKTVGLPYIGMQYEALVYEGATHAEGVIRCLSEPLASIIQRYDSTLSSCFPAFTSFFFDSAFLFSLLAGSFANGSAEEFKSILKARGIKNPARAELVAEYQRLKESSQAGNNSSSSNNNNSSAGDGTGPALVKRASMAAIPPTTTAAMAPSARKTTMTMNIGDLARFDLFAITNQAVQDAFSPTMSSPGVDGAELVGASFYSFLSLISHPRTHPLSFSVKCPVSRRRPPPATAAPRTPLRRPRR